MENNYDQEPEPMDGSHCDFCGCHRDSCECDYPEYDDSMDGDHQSALASAGFGTDEDYRMDYSDNEDDGWGTWAGDY